METSVTVAEPTPPPVGHATPTFTCVVQPAPALPACPKPQTSAGWFDSVLGMSWAFAVLLMVLLLLCFGPRGKFGDLLAAISRFIDRLKDAEFAGLSLSTEAREALDKSADRVAGATPILEGAKPRSTADTQLIEKLLRKDYSGVTVGDYPYLLHEGSRTPKGRFPYAARVYVEFWTDNKDRFQKNDVEKVYYRVDDSFPEKWWVMSGDDARRNFQLVVRVVGEFTIIAVVKLKSGDLIWLTRHLDLPGRPAD